MPKYRVRYKLGQAPAHADDDDAITVQAAMFETEGKFVDFYGRARRSSSGRLLPSGGVVFRVHEDVLADIREQDADAG